MERRWPQGTVWWQTFCCNIGTKWKVDRIIWDFLHAIWREHCEPPVAGPVLQTLPSQAAVEKEIPLAAASHIRELRQLDAAIQNIFVIYQRPASKTHSRYAVQTSQFSIPLLQTGAVPATQACLVRSPSCLAVRCQKTGKKYPACGNARYYHEASDAFCWTKCKPSKSNLAWLERLLYALAPYGYHSELIHITSTYAAMISQFHSKNKQVWQKKWSYLVYGWTHLKSIWNTNYLKQVHPASNMAFSLFHNDMQLPIVYRPRAQFWGRIAPETSLSHKFYVSFSSILRHALLCQDCQTRR